MINLIACPIRFYIEQIAVSKRLLTCYVVHGQGVREMLIISHKVQGASRSFLYFPDSLLKYLQKIHS